jgi:CheY-like chemotaxis protein
MGQAMCVLVVDDDDDVRALIGMELRRVGYEVHTAPNGAAALELAGAFPPSVILLDLAMPIMDGRQFARAYLGSAGRHAKIVVITGRGEAAGWATQLGADAVLGKPFDLGELCRTIGQLVG